MSEDMHVLKVSNADDPVVQKENGSIRIALKLETGLPVYLLLPKAVASKLLKKMITLGGFSGFVG